MKGRSNNILYTEGKMRLHLVMGIFLPFFDVLDMTFKSNVNGACWQMHVQQLFWRSDVYKPTPILRKTQNAAHEAKTNNRRKPVDVTFVVALKGITS